MNKNFALTIAGIIFSLVAIMHALRLYYHWVILAAGLSIPMSVSIIGLIISGFLALWMFLAAVSRHFSDPRVI